MRINNSAQFRNAASDPRNVPTRMAEGSWLHAKKTLLGFAQHDVTLKDHSQQDGDGSGNDDGGDSG